MSTRAPRELELSLATLREAFRELIATEPVMREALLATLAAEVRRLTHHVEELHFLDITGRLAAMPGIVLDLDTVQAFVLVADLASFTRAAEASASAAARSPLRRRSGWRWWSHPASTRTSRTRRARPSRSSPIAPLRRSSDRFCRCGRRCSSRRTRISPRRSDRRARRAGRGEISLAIISGSDTAA